MRAVVFPSEAVVADECGALARMGEVGGLAASWLRGLVRDEVLVARSFSLYVGVLRRFAAHATETTAPGGPFTAEVFAGFLVDTARSSWRRQLSTAVLRRFLGPDTPERSAFESALAQVASGQSPVPSGDSPAPSIEGGDPAGTPARVGRGLTVAQLDAVDQEASRVLNAAAQGVDDLGVQRAALIALCRHGGALASDLAALTFDDLAADRGCVWGSGGIGTAWRVLRVRREAVGTAKNRPVVIDLPAKARRWVDRWVEVRQRRWGAGAITGDALVFLDLAADRPLDRKDVWRIVAAIGDPAAGTKTAKKLNAGTPLTDGGSDAPFGERVELSPALLRHCLALELVRTDLSGEALEAAFATRLGTEGTGAGITRYRRLLHQARPGRGRPRRVAERSGTSA